MSETTEQTPTTLDTDPRILALVKMLDCEADDIEAVSYIDDTFVYGRQEFRVLTDEEADEACAKSISEMLWAFNTSFIASHTRNGLNPAARKALQKAQGELCEDANDLVAALIEDMDHFVRDAVSADGRGHFLANYDGEEREESVNGTTYYIFRNN